MAKKRFGIDQATSDAISQTMVMAKNHDSDFVNTEILISKIEVDPDNPRKHLISLDELNDGIKKSDPKYQLKKLEYDGLCELSSSIKKDGLLHPIVVFKSGDMYRLVAGERRLYASIIASKNQIEARVFKEKPKLFDLKIIQWVENESRKNLSLFKKLMNVKSILDTYTSNHGERITAIALSKLLSISRQSSQYYLSIISNPLLLKLIKEGKVSRLKVAKELIPLKTEEEMLKFILERKSSKSKNVGKDKSGDRGRRQTKVSLGNTKNVAVVERIVNTILSLDSYKHHASEFDTVDWSCFKESSNAFNKLLKILENNEGVLA